MMKKTLLVFLTTAFVASLVGCNTAEGIGEDVENAGDAVSDTVNDIQE